MYLGDCSKELSHGTVVSVLRVADILQLDGLNQKCIEYSEQNLDHSNYEHVVKLADRFNSPG